MAEPAKKSLTLVSRSAPYGTENAQVCLDVVLAGSVFDQQVNYLFLGDGVYQLLNSQQASSIDCKNLAGAFEALELYGVDQVYVDELSLQQRGLNVDDLVLAVKPLNDDQLRVLIRTSDLVLSL